MHPVEMFVRWGESQPQVRAILLTGSLASPAPYIDVLSDYDVILVLDSIQPFFEDDAWLRDFGDVLARYRDPLIPEDGLYTGGYVVQYESGLKIDFTLWSVESMQRVVSQKDLPVEFDAGYRILLDKDALTANLKPATFRGYIPEKPSEQDYLVKLENFFLDCCYVAKFLWRDDMVAAKHVLDGITKQENLIPMLEWLIEIEHDWKIKPAPYGRRLKKWLRPALWAQLEATFGGMGRDENWQALENTLDLMRSAAIKAGHAMGYAYPDEMEQRTRNYLQRIRRLPADAAHFPD